MTETVSAKVPLTRWQGERGTYHLVTFEGESARPIDERALLDRLEFGRGRGFGSVKVHARIGETQWRTSVFPQRSTNSDRGGDESGKDYILLVSRKVMTREGLAPGDTVDVELSF